MGFLSRRHLKRFLLRARQGAWPRRPPSGDERVFLVSYPKAGATWLQFMVAQVYARTAGTVAA